MVMIGFTTTELPVNAPGFQDSEPIAVGATAVSVVLSPGQVMVGEADPVIEGPWSAITEMVAVLVQEPAPPMAV